MQALTFFHTFLFLRYMHFAASTFRGVKMCLRECLYLKTCSAVDFDPKLLRCMLIGHNERESVQTSAQGGRIQVKKDLATVDLLRNCDKNDLLLLNKQKMPVCVPNIKLSAERKSYLLILPREKTMTVGYEMNLLTRKVVEFHNSVKAISAVTYLTSAKQLLVGSNSRVVSTTVSLQNEVVLKRGIYAHTICADEEREYIFAVTKRGHVLRMSMTGQEMKLIFRLMLAELKLEIDTKSKALFAIEKWNLVSRSYDGIKTKVIVKLSNVGALAYDSSTNSFLYASKSDVKKVTSDGRTFYLGSVKSRLKRRGFVNMKVCGNYLYMSLGSWNIIRISLLDPRQITDLDINTKGFSRKYGIALSIIES